MFLIQRVTSDPYQKQALVLEDGTALSITLYFRPMQRGWFFNEIVYEDFLLQGLRITNSPNMLNQFQNKLPFGIACYSTNMREPSLQNDFASGASKLYILNAAEVMEYEEYLRGG